MRIIQIIRGCFIGLISLITGLILPILSYALPEGGSVVGGEATIQTVSPNQMDIHQFTDRASINWNQFNIASNEGVRFVQPGSESIALNRVTGVDPSEILGNLSANGRVFLINPNGILFGQNATIDVSGLLATTLSTDVASFMSGGNLLFEGDRGSVVNQGRITVTDSGFVFLIAPGVKNEGLIVARLGKVVLGSSERLAIDFMGDGLLQYRLDGDMLGEIKGPGGVPLTAAVDQMGTILAEGGEVILSATASSGIFKSLINQTGIIRANSLVNRGGIIRLEASLPVANTGVIGRDANFGGVKGAKGDVIHTGILDVSGATGGEITLSGEGVEVSGEINANGGDVLITSAMQTTITSGSKIDASGIGTGDAGNVVVWSDGTTLFGGDILARGGETGGNAGDVEVSGYQHLGFAGHVDLSALYGNVGTLLLDPASWTITKGAGTGAVDTMSEFAIEAIKSDLELTANSITMEKLDNGTLALPANLSLTLKTDTGAITFKSLSDIIQASGTGGITINQGEPAASGGGKLAVGKLIVESGVINIIANGDITVKQATALAGTVNITSNSGSLTEDGSDNIRANTATLSALNGSITSTAGQGGDYDIKVKHLTLRVGQGFDVQNADGLETLDITTTQAGDTGNIYKLESDTLTFIIADGGDFYQITNVADNATLKNFTFKGDQEIRVGNISVASGKVNLISELGSIVELTPGASNIAASAVDLSTPLGSSIGVGGGLPIKVSSSDLTLASGASINVSSSNDLNVLAITASTQGGATNSYSVAAPGLTFKVTDAGANYLIENVADTTGLNFTFIGDKAIHLGTINVIPTTAGGVGVVPAPVVTLASTAGQINDNEKDTLKDIDITAASVILTAAGGIGITNGDLDLKVDVLKASSTNGAINISDAGDLLLDTIDAGTNKVTLTVKDGAINDDIKDDVVDITAGTASLIAKTGIGVTNGDIDLKVANVSSVETETGGINMQSLIPASFTNIKTTGPGKITLIGNNGETRFTRISSSDGNIDLTVNKGILRADTITASGNGNISLATKGSGDILYRNLVAEGNSIVKDAEGRNIIDLDDPTSASIPPPPENAVRGDLTSLDRAKPPVGLTDLGIGADQVIEVSMIPHGKEGRDSTGEKLYLMEGEGLGLEGEPVRQKENVIPPPAQEINTGEAVPAEGEVVTSPTDDKEATSVSSDSDVIEIDEGLGIEKGSATSTSTRSVPPPPSRSQGGSSGTVPTDTGAIKEETIPLKEPEER